jgi:hypothetical protein
MLSAFLTILGGLFLSEIDYCASATSFSTLNYKFYHFD